MMLCLLHKVHGVIFTCVFLHTQLHLQMVLPYLELTHTWFETNTFFIEHSYFKRSLKSPSVELATDNEGQWDKNKKDDRVIALTDLFMDDI